MERRFPNSSARFEASYDRARYLERTARNAMWIGGAEGQDAVYQMRMCVAGLGGMGGHIAELLARLGVGHIRIADPDVIDRSNINRQTIATTETLGRPKAEVAAARVRAIAPDCELVVYDDGVTQANVNELVDGCDAVVDEIDVDVLDKHVLLHKAARERDLPVYSAYILGMGAHFYKFRGDDYTFEDFIGPVDDLMAPPDELLPRRFGFPFTSYYGMDDLMQELDEGGIPMFGPGAVAGQSLLTSRVVLDLLAERVPRYRASYSSIPETPRMPEFLKLDLADLEMRRVRIPDAD